MSRRIIITADDYGMCQSVNEGIEECLAAGAMRATCVMTNMPEVGALTTLRTRFPQASIGLHWTLTQGRPVLPAAQVPTLVDRDGQFLSFSQMRQRLMIRQLNLGQVHAELMAQYARFRELGGKPDFWNTHQNIHVSPRLFETFVATGLECGITAMRSQRRITAPATQSTLAYNLSHPLYWLKGQMIARWSSAAESRGIAMPDGAIHTPGFSTGKAAIEESVKRVRWSAVRQAAEFIIHPATRIEPELFGEVTEARLREYQVFRDPGLQERLRQQDVETVGFEVLSTRTATTQSRAIRSEHS